MQTRTSHIERIFVSLSVNQLGAHLQMVATLIMYSTIHQNCQQHKCHLKINISLQMRLNRYWTSSSNLDWTMGRQYLLAEPPRGNIYKLQRMQKMAIRMFTSTTRRDVTTSMFTSTTRRDVTTSMYTSTTRRDVTTSMFTSTTHRDETTSMQL